MSLAALVLAAGRGNRLRPLTDTTPKPLLPIGRTTLLDLTLERIATVVPVTPGDVAVNVHWLADQIVTHLAGRVHVSVEEPVALGTAGAVGAIREWLAGRDLLIANSDTFIVGEAHLTELVDGWDAAQPRLLVTLDEQRPDFGGRWRFAGTSLLPARLAATLPAAPLGLYEAIWSRCSLDLVPTDAVVIDCGTPDDYDRARVMAAPRSDRG